MLLANVPVIFFGSAFAGRLPLRAIRIGAALLFLGIGSLFVWRSLHSVTWAMNYRHVYHAGNFADVAKHVALLYCLEALQRKEAPFFALDTHAGRGVYDLQAPEARKSGEAERGVQQLIATGFGDPALAAVFRRDPREPRQTPRTLSRFRR